MQQLILTLSSGSDQKDLYFDIFDCTIAQKWAKEVNKNLSIHENDRFINWPRSKKDRQYYVSELNKQMQIVEDYAPNSVPFFLTIEAVNQHSFNVLHKFFEEARGPSEEGTEFFNNAPRQVQIAISRFNIMIHEFENFIHNELKNSIHPESRLIVTFNDRLRYDLADEDYNYFTVKWIFGQVYINYCEVGKGIIDVIMDNDSIIGNSAIKPLRYYSADFQVKFFRSMNDIEHERLLQFIKHKFNSKKEFFKNLGFTFDKKLSIGLIPVAELNRNDSGFASMTDLEIINSLGIFNTVSKTAVRQKTNI
jgi:hypothetical protein